jgi:hypothetical protein
MIISGDYKEHFQRRLDTFKKLYLSNAILLFVVTLTEFYRLSYLPNIMLLIVFKTLVGIACIAYVFSKNVSVGFHIVGGIYCFVAGLQADFFTDNNIPFQFELFTLQTGLLAFSCLAFTGMRLIYSILGAAWVILIYFWTFTAKQSFSYSYFYLTAFIFFGIVINGILQDNYDSEKEMVELINYYKDYSIQLLGNNLPRKYHLMNVTSLYVDVSGIFSYFYKDEKLGFVKGILKKLYGQFELERKNLKIDTNDEDRGFYSFLIYENPANTDANYAEPLAEFAILIRDYFEQLCRERNINFKLRMGMHSGKFVDYSYESKNSLLTVFKTIHVLETARKMENEGINGQIQTTSDTYSLLKKNFILIRRDISGGAETEQGVYILKEKRTS